VPKGAAGKLDSAGGRRVSPAIVARRSRPASAAGTSAGRARGIQCAAGRDRRHVNGPACLRRPDAAERGLSSAGLPPAQHVPPGYRRAPRAVGGPGIGCHTWWCGWTAQHDDVHPEGGEGVPWIGQAPHSRTAPIRQSRGRGRTFTPARWRCRRPLAPPRYRSLQDCCLYNDAWWR